MEEDFESSDISAAQLAAIQNKGQFARSVSLALSADAKENEQPISAPAPEQDRGRGPETNSAPGRGDADESFKTVEEAIAELGVQEDFSSEGSDASSDDEIDFVEGTPLPTQEPAHCRRKTKLQRRRMRQLLRAEFLERFARGSDVEDAIEIVEGADQPQRVPTLMELCMQKGPRRSGPLPPGLKPVVSQHKDRARLAAVQLRWLCHNLAVLEVQIKWSTLEVMLPHGVKTFMLRRDARSLWRTNVAINWRSYMNPPPEKHPEEGQWILPVSLQNLASVDWKIAALAHYLNLTLSHQYSSPNAGTQPRSEESQLQRRVDVDVFQAKQYLQKRYPNLVQHCFDLALAYVWWARGKCTRAQEAFLKVIQHYPTDRDSSETQHSTLWARHKAMVLVDIGRLLVSFGQCDSAGRFYREAIEIATRNVCASEVSKLTLQSQALAASAYDQGLMDRHSAIQAARLWRTTTEYAQTFEDTSPWSPDNRWRGNDIYTLHPYLEKGPRDAVLAAVESLLHCHAGCSTDPLNQGSLDASKLNQSWLMEARACLEELLTPRCGLVGLYLSMIIAMLGGEVAAERAFDFHLARYGYGTQAPGLVAMLMSEDNAKPHPWWLFQEWIDVKTKALGKVIGVPLQVLPLLWRRGLGHPSYCHDRSTDVSREQAADVQGVTPDLSVTPKGHLSAAMLQNLPPLRTVCLHLHTGKVLFDCSCSEQPHKWDNFCQPLSYNDLKFAEFRINCNLMLPQPVVVYTNPTTSATVTVAAMNCMKAYYTSEAKAEWFYRTRRCGKFLDSAGCIRRETWPSMSATFQDATGREKIDIVELYYQGLKKFLLEETSSWRNKHEDKYSKQAEEVMDYLIKRRLDTTVEVFQHYLEQSRSGLSPNETTFHNEPRCAKHCRGLTFSLDNVMYIGKTTVVLTLTSSQHDVFMYLDCTSPSTFSQQVVVKFQGPNSHFTWLQSPDQKGNILLTYHEIVSSEGSPDKYKVSIFDEKGNIVLADSDIKMASELQLMVCHGDKVLQTEARTSVVSFDFKTKNLRYSPETFSEIVSLAVAENLLFVLTQGGVHALDADTLEPMVVVHHTKQQGVNAPGSNDAGLLLFVSNATYLDVLGSHEVSITGERAGRYHLAFLGFQNHILSLRRRKACDDEGTSDVVEVWDIMVPGKPTELCYISEQAGFVVSATVFSSVTDSHYRENLYWFSMSGDLIAIHPFLGGGRHGFLPVYMNDPAPEDADDEKGRGAQGVWHLYFADGLGALCCIRLEDA